MLAKRGLRERPTYESLMQTLRNDFPLQLPNRDAYFLRNSIQMMQFDGIGMLDNLEEQSNKIAESQLRAAVLKDVASGKGVDAKLIQTDPGEMADKYTGMKQPKDKSSGTNSAKTSEQETSTDPMTGTRSSGSSTDKRSTVDSGNDPMFGTADSSSQVAPILYDIADDPIQTDSHETQVDTQIEDRQSSGRRKWEKAKDLVKQHLDKTKSTTAKIVEKAEADKEKRQSKMEADPANEAMIKPDPGASSSSRGVSPPKKAETRKDQTPLPSPIKKKVKTEDVKVEVKNEPESKHEPKGKPGRPQSVPKRTAEAPPESAAPRPRGRPRKDAQRSESADLSVKTSKLSNNLDRGWWDHNTSAKEIRNQLSLRGINKDLWIFKNKEENLTLLLKTIKAQTK
jgi:hypothetical protein